MPQTVPARLVLLPARAGEVAAHDRFDGHDRSRPADHDPAAEVVERSEVGLMPADGDLGLDGRRPGPRVVSRRWLGTIAAGLGEPEPRQAGEHAALVRDHRVGRTTSKALIRSEATSSSRSSVRRRGRGPCPERRNDSASIGHRRVRRGRARAASAASRPSSRAMTSGTWWRNEASSKQASSCVERQPLGHGRIRREQVAQRRPLVGGPQGARAGRPRRPPRATGRRARRGRRARDDAWSPRPRSMFSRIRSERTTRPSTSPVILTSM